MIFICGDSWGLQKKAINLSVCVKFISSALSSQKGVGGNLFAFCWDSLKSSLLTTSLSRVDGSERENQQHVRFNNFKPPPPLLIVVLHHCVEE